MRLRKILGLAGTGLCSIGLLVLPFVGEVDINEFITQIAVVIFALGLGIAYWTFKPEIDRRINKEFDKPQYNAKKLNKTIFKKLMRVECFYDYFLFSDKLWFGIPIDQRAFTNKQGNVYTEWLVESMGLPFHDKYTTIESEIPTLSIGEKYLQREYPNVYQDWNKIKKTVIDHNKKYTDFVEDLGKQVEQKLSNIFPAFISNVQEQPEARNIYFLDNIQKQLARAIEHNLKVEKTDPPFTKKTTFEEPFVSRSSNNNYWILLHSRINGEVLMASYDKDMLDSEKMKQILCSILNNQNNITSFIESKNYDYRIHDEINQFNDRLENEVVHDIDNQL